MTDAFEQGQEARLVDDLRSGGQLIVSLVAEWDSQICGYVALSRLRSPSKSLALAPVAVTPHLQNRGIGAALIKQAIQSAAAQGWRMIFVLGDPNYYSRFGFSTDAAKGYPCPFAGPYFMALQLDGEAPPPEPVVYAPAFDNLG